MGGDLRGTPFAFLVQLGDQNRVQVLHRWYVDHGRVGGMLLPCESGGASARPAASAPVGCGFQTPREDHETAGSGDFTPLSGAMPGYLQVHPLRQCDRSRYLPRICPGKADRCHVQSGQRSR